MFNIDFIAAQVGAEVELGGDVFEYGSATSDADKKIAIADTVTPLVTGGKRFVWARPADKQIDPVKYEMAEGEDFITVDAANVEYCIMYRKAVDGKQITVSSQFIPDTVHAVLTVALYSGDSCDGATC